MKLAGFGRGVAPAPIDEGAGIVAPDYFATRAAPAPAPVPAVEATQVVRVPQTQIDPRLAAQSLSLPEIKGLPSPLKEETVAAALTLGRQDVAREAARQLNPNQIEALPAPARDAVAVARQALEVEAAPAAVAREEALKARETVAGRVVGSPAPAAATGDPRVDQLIQAVVALQARLDAAEAQLGRQEAAIKTVSTEYVAAWRARAG